MTVNKRTIVMRAREMRNNMTPAERKLWYDCLSKLPWKFRRQSNCGYYILDFFCVPLSLAIEVDGNQHHTSEGLEYDQIRDDFLSHYGIKVLRFSNQQVLENFDEVCTRITEECNQRPQQYRKKNIPLIYDENGQGEE